MPFNNLAALIRFYNTIQKILIDSGADRDNGIVKVSEANYAFYQENTPDNCLFR